MAVHHRHRGEGQGFQAVEHGVQLGQFGGHQRRIAHRAELGDVGADHESRALARAQHQAPRRIGLQPGQDVVQRRQHGRVNAVGG